MGYGQTLREGNPVDVGYGDLMAKQTDSKPDFPPVPPAMAAAAITTMAHIYRVESWGFQQIADKVMECASKPSPHHEDGLFQVSECDPFLDDNMLWRMVKKGTIPNKNKLKAIILWILNSNYDKYFLTQESEEILKSKESDVFHIRNALGFDSPLKPYHAGSWQGSFKLYQPFHLDPLNRALVSRLDVGLTANGNEEQGSEFACQLVTEFVDDFDDNRKNFATGKVIPCGETRAMAILHVGRNIDNHGHYALHFNVTARDDESGSVTAFTGILTAAIGSTPSSWPMFGRRLSEKDAQAFRSHILEPEEFLTLPKQLKDQIDMGGVHWEKDFAPRSLSRSYQQAAEAKQAAATSSGQSLLPAPKP